jgi:enamine deaminase RidA (YjgF/YER057c/UK114 family)
MAGQVGTGASGMAPDSLVEQMKNAYQHTESVLEAFDCTMDNIVEETWFVTNMHECMI